MVVLFIFQIISAFNSTRRFDKIKKFSYVSYLLREKRDHSNKGKNII